MSSLLSLQKGASANLNNVVIKDGQLLVTTDTKQIYLDNDTTRLLLNDYPVKSVNGKTGTVSLSYSDVGASKAIKSITRSGTTFTYTCLDGTTGTFTQQDNNTTYSAGTGISLSGTTFSNSGVRSIAIGSNNGTISVNTNGTSTDVAVKGLDNSAFNAAYSKYCLHDLFAFCRMITPTFESTTNGSTWIAQTLNKKIFIQKEIGTGSRLFGNSTLAYRWTWSGNGFSYSGAKYLVLKSTYNNPGLSVTIKVESQNASDSSWTVLGTGTTSGLNSGYYVLQTSGVSGSISALRITITKVDSSDTTGSINLTSMQYLTDRPGDQGGDIAYELPFDWDENRAINAINLSVQSYQVLHAGNWNQYCAASSHTHSYLPLSGGTMTGAITISHTANATMDKTTTNPRIIFSESGSQPVGLVYTDYDSYRAPAGLKVLNLSDNQLAWFEAEGEMYAAGGNKVHHNGNLKFSLSGTTLTITKS